MSSVRVWMRWSLLILVGCCLCWPASAEDVEKKFRIGLGVGFLNQQDSKGSDSANVLNLFDDAPKRVDQFSDPRNDSGAFGTLEIKSGPLATLSGQYAVNKIFVIELSAGYQRADMGDVEVQAQFRGIKVPTQQNFNFSIFRFPVGEVEQIPVQATFLARFRPRSSFNPYVGGGFGYTFLGFEPDPEFDDLSVKMDASQGQFCRVTSSWFGNETLQCPAGGRSQDLAGATVDIEDTWEWHIVAGAEFSFKRHWVAFVDLRYSWSARQVNVSFDGEGDLGTGVPALQDFCSNAPGSTPPGGSVNPPTVCPGSAAGTAALEGKYGAVNISVGGLVDGGRIVQRQDLSTQDQLMYCSAIAAPTPEQECFIPEPDGQVDSGFYYAQGGSFKLDAFSVLVGVRYTF